MDSHSITERTRMQVERAVRAVEEARSRSAAAHPANGRPAPAPAPARPPEQRLFEHEGVD